MTIRRIATDKTTDLWLIDGDVWRAPVNCLIDMDGMPAGKRWECSIEMYRRYRDTVFNGFTEVKP